MSVRLFSSSAERVIRAPPCSSLSVEIDRFSTTNGWSGFRGSPQSHPRRASRRKAPSSWRNKFPTMLISRVFVRALFSAAKSESSAFSTSTAAAAAAATDPARKASNPLEEFFELDRSTEEEKPIVYGRGWKASELRLKSWDDLHKLWYVLLKEKNMLLTQRQMLHSQNLRFPNPDRIPKVRKSMSRIKHVLTVRGIAELDPRRSAEMKRMINAL